jgi:hypothetical protein
MCISNVIMLIVCANLYNETELMIYDSQSGLHPLCAIGIAVISFAFAAWLFEWVNSRPSSNKRIAEVGKLIRSGAYTL